MCKNKSVCSSQVQCECLNLLILALNNYHFTVHWYPAVEWYQDGHWHWLNMTQPHLEYFSPVATGWGWSQLSPRPEDNWTSKTCSVASAYGPSVKAIWLSKTGFLMISCGQWKTHKPVLVHEWGNWWSWVKKWMQPSRWEGTHIFKWDRAEGIHRTVKQLKQVPAQSVHNLWFQCTNCYKMTESGRGESGEALKSQKKWHSQLWCWCITTQRRTLCYHVTHHHMA